MASYPALPAYGGMARSGTRAATGYRAAIRDIFGGAASGGRSIGRHVARTSGRALGVYRGFATRDTVGGLVAQQLPPGLAAMGMGALNASAPGKAFAAMTGGWFNLGTVPAAAAVLMRGLNIDRHWSPLRSFNSAVIRGWVPVWMSQRGEWLGNRFFGGESAGSAPLSGAPSSVSGAETAGAAAHEPIPGEA